MWTNYMYIVRPGANPNIDLFFMSLGEFTKATYHFINHRQ